MKDPRSPSYSVVIPTRNRQAYLQSCVESVACQLPAPREIIIVDDGSSPPVQKDRFRDLRIVPRILRNPDSRGQGTSRNAGARECSSEVVVFVDDDNVIAPTCAPLLANQAREGTCAVAVQMIKGHDQATWSADWTWITSSPRPESLSQFLRATSLHPPESATVRVTHPSNVYAIRKFDFDRVGGFNQGFFSRYLEDVELGFRLRKAGIVCVVVGDAITHHTVHGGQPPLPNALAWKARGNLTQRYLTLWELFPSFMLSLALAGRTDLEITVRGIKSTEKSSLNTFVGSFLRGFLVKELA